MFKFLIPLLMLFPLACDDDCKMHEFRCNGDLLELCDSENNWSTAINCAEFEDLDNPDTKVVCCDHDPMLDGEANCTVEDECNEKD